MLNPQARPLVREGYLHRQSQNRAFTLIELLTVMAIIAILAAITFGIVKGVQERAAIGQAKAELAVLAQALESYKQQYGDYPQTTAANVATTSPATATDAPGVLFNSLTGQLGPTGVSIAGKAFVDLNKFSLQDTTAIPLPTGSDPKANAFVDPWGRRYLYYYYTQGTTTLRRGYILLSVGPDGLQSPPTVSGTSGGTIDRTAANNPDNIYANY